MASIRSSRFSGESNRNRLSSDGDGGGGDGGSVQAGEAMLYSPEKWIRFRNNPDRLRNDLVYVRCTDKLLRFRNDPA
jgi:hypothetical protein